MSEVEPVQIVQFREDGEVQEIAFVTDDQTKNGYMRYQCWEMDSLIVTEEQKIESKTSGVPIQLRSIPPNYTFTLDNEGQVFVVENIHPDNEIAYTKFYLNNRVERMLNQMFLTVLNKTIGEQLN